MGQVETGNVGLKVKVASGVLVDSHSQSGCDEILRALRGVRGDGSVGGRGGGQDGRIENRFHGDVLHLVEGFEAEMTASHRVGPGQELVRQFVVGQLGVGGELVARRIGLAEDDGFGVRRGGAALLGGEVGKVDAVVQAGGDADFHSGGGFHFSGELQIGRIGETGRMALVGIVVADGQPTAESDVVAGFAGHAHVRLFGRSRRQIQTPRLGRSGGFGVRLLLGLLGCSRRLLAGACWAAGCWSAGAVSCGACARTNDDVHTKARQSKPVREIFTYASTIEIKPAQTGNRPLLHQWVQTVQLLATLLFCLKSTACRRKSDAADCGRIGTGVEFA